MTSPLEAAGEAECRCLTFLLDSEFVEASDLTADEVGQTSTGWAVGAIKPELQTLAEDAKVSFPTQSPPPLSTKDDLASEAINPRDVAIDKVFFQSEGQFLESTQSEQTRGNTASTAPLSGLNVERAKDNTVLTATFAGSPGDPQLKVPGAGASTVHVESLWSSMLRWIIRGPSCGLKSFLLSSFQSRASQSKRSDNVGRVWPMPLPFPRLGKRGDKKAKAEKQALNAIVLVNNWLHLRQPNRVPADYILDAKLTSEQQKTIQRLQRLLGDWVECPPITANDMGRSAGKIETVEIMLQHLTVEAQRVVREHGSGKQVGPSVRSDTMLGEVQVAKPIEAHRLKFGGTPMFCPLPFLDSETAEMYKKPISLSTPPELAMEEPPRVNVRGSRKEVLALLKLLDNTNRLALFPPAAVRMQHRSGLFSLMKNLSTDRMILDSRPANTLEAGYSNYTQTMGSIIPFLQTYLRPENDLKIAGEDLRDFYYYFRVGKERARRNALAMSLSRQEASNYKAFAETDQNHSHYVPALGTMAMGDKNAVEIGQQSHVQLALASGLHLNDLLTLRGSVPRQNWTAGILIDDFVVLEQTERESKPPFLSSQIADNVVASYDAVGLKAHDQKRMREQTVATFWGSLVNGSSGLVRAQLERTVPVAFITSQVCRLGVANRKLLEVLSGAWVAILQYRRRCMCLLESVFRDIVHHDYDEVFPLHADTLSELWTLVVLAPTFCSDLRARPANKLTMVDASDEWTAQVDAEIPVELGQELERHQLTKASWSRLLSPLRALQRLHGQLPPELEVPPGEEPVRAHPLWTKLARCLAFGNAKKKKIRRRTHINLDEMKAALTAEREAAENCPNQRQVIASDSQVVLGAVVKGRSSARSLNKLLRSQLPFLLGYNNFTAWHYVNTRDNPADDPTRDHAVRSPVESSPGWLDDIYRGNYQPFDDWLSATDASLEKIARMPLPPDPIPQLPLPASERHQRRKDFQRTFRAGRAKAKSSRPPSVAAPPRATPWLPRSQLTDEVRQLLSAFPASQFVLPRGKSLAECLTKAGHLDLFSGSRGAARALARRTGRFALTFDIAHSAAEDLLDGTVQQQIEKLVEEGAFLTLTGGPVCASFSRAVRPAVRTAAEPHGLENISPAMKEKVLQGNKFSAWVSKLSRRAVELAMVVWIENPAGSFLWLQDEWQKLMSDGLLSIFKTDYCVWGTPWRKRTIFLNNVSGLRDEKLLCRCLSKKHRQLVGYSAAHGKSWTKVAEPYPGKLCEALAMFVAENLKPTGRQKKLNVAQCARCNARVGEAAHPGPRRRQPRNTEIIDLEDVQRLKPATLVIQSKVHSMFANWLSAELTAGAFTALKRCPKLQVNFLRTFGNYLFSTGKPMYLFRHLTVFLQHRYPSEVGPLSQAWELLARWEIAEPVSHRPPLPKLVLDALVALAITWNWPRVAAIILLAYHGVMRIGEPLRSFREDLLLPVDTAGSIDGCFLLIKNPKSGARGKGRIQHSRIRDKDAVNLAAFVFGNLEPHDRLYGGSPASFRRRWDKLCAALQIPQHMNITPACCRGGGAVHLYHLEVPVTNILWQMRIKNLITLESYLQEVAAINITQQLTTSSRNLCTNFAKLLPLLMRRFTPD